MRLRVKKERGYMIKKRNYDSVLPDMCEMYELGISLKEISEKYEVNSGTLIGLLKKVGIFKKKRNDWSKEDDDVIRLYYPTESKHATQGFATLVNKNEEISKYYLRAYPELVDR